MTPGIFCRQNGGCPNFARYRFTWPGQDESFICEEHANKLKAVARAMGMHQQFIELTDADHAEAADARLNQ